MRSLLLSRMLDWKSKVFPPAAGHFKLYLPCFVAFAIGGLFLISPYFNDKFARHQAKKIASSVIFQSQEQDRLPGTVVAPSFSISDRFLNWVISPDISIFSKKQVSEEAKRQSVEAVLDYSIVTLPISLEEEVEIEGDKFFSQSEQRSILRSAMQKKTAQVRFTDRDQSVIGVFSPLLLNGEVAAVLRLYIGLPYQRAVITHLVQVWILISAVTVLSLILVLVRTRGMPKAKQERAEDDAAFLAFHDPLTGLANRREFENFFAEIVENIDYDDRTFAILSLDVDKFKEVNDVYGHAVGDKVLQIVANCLTGQIRGNDKAFRLSGDEFTIVLDGVDQEEDIHVFCDRILGKISKVRQIEGYYIGVSVSIGAAIYPKNSKDAEELLKFSDLALYQAKGQGRNQVCVFDSDLELRTREKRSLNEKLRAAFRSDALELHYQPQIDVLNGHLTGFEALMRWEHPKDGPIAPDVFLPAAGETGLIMPIEEWVLSTACAKAMELPVNISMAVNLSAFAFSRGDIVADIQEALEGSGLPGERLEIEITESLLLQNQKTIKGVLEAINDLGVKIVVDDFGMGYSNLSHLSKLPISKIKVDQSFISKITSDSQAVEFIKTIISMGRIMEVDIIAEGVETFEQAQQLRAVGCVNMQGFLYGRPSQNPFDAFKVWGDGENGEVERLA